MNLQQKYTTQCRQTGASYLTLAVFSAILGAIVYSAYCIIPFYYCYFELHNQFLAVIPKADTLTDEQIRQRLTKILKDLDVPVDPKELKLDRSDHKYRVRLNYTEIFYISFKGKDYDIYTFPFHLDVQGPF